MQAALNAVACTGESDVSKPAADPGSALRDMSGIYLRDGDRYVAMRETPYHAEEVLQELIERHPEMLAGGEESGHSLILIRREAGVSEAEDSGVRWSLDHLYLDKHGIPTLVEVKRSTDTRSRREVVAQMLEYAAHARTSFGVERMADWLDEVARQRGRSGSDMLFERFGIEDVEGFWQTVDTNLKAERLRLIFVADRIGAELRSIIEYLNRQMTSTEVLAIEVKQYTDAEGKHQTIVPRLVGDTEEARAVKRAAPRGEVLDHEEVVARLRDHDAEAAQAADAILDWAEHEPRIDVRYTATFGIIDVGRTPVLKLRLAPDSVRRALEIHLETLVKHGHPWDDAHIEQLVRDLAGVGIELDPGRRWPNASIEPLADQERRQQFLRLIERVIDTLVE